MRNESTMSAERLASERLAAMCAMADRERAMIAELDKMKKRAGDLEDQMLRLCNTIERLGLGSLTPELEACVWFSRATIGGAEARKPEGGAE